MVGPIIGPVLAASHPGSAIACSRASGPRSILARVHRAVLLPP